MNLSDMPDRVDVLTTPISATTIEQVSFLVTTPPPEGIRIAVSNVHSVMTARRDPALASALRNAEIATPDGMPLVWALKASGLRHQERVTGYDILHASLTKGSESGVRHFFYGSIEPVLANLVAAIGRSHPDAIVVGSYAPPFRALTTEEEVALVNIIQVADPDVVWIGLGMPKQELFMEAFRSRLPGVALVGIGAVFDWVAGNTRRAPRWMQQLGLEWAFRLAMEPRRLWRRYVLNNPLFLILLTRQVLGDRLRRSPQRSA